MSASVDLKQLAVAREPSQPRGRRRRLFSRYVFPGCVVLGFLGMLAWAARDRLLAARPVTVVPVVVMRAEVRQAGTPLFRAAGWVQPRPVPVLVPALAEGVIEQLLVVEGQDVQAGQVVARLVDTDARLAVEQADFDVRLRAAELAGAQAELKAARLRLERPAHLQAPVAEAEAILIAAQDELARLPFAIRTAQAEAQYARQELERKKSAGDAVAGRLLQQAQSRCDAAISNVEDLQGRSPRLESRVSSLRKRCAALQSQLDLRIDEARQVAETEARVAACQARLQQGHLALTTRQLALERMVVKAPASGRVLQLLAGPGSRVTGVGSGRSAEAAGGNSVASLYDPAMLQIRTDVRLEDVPRIRPGQLARIETASVEGMLEGEVLYATSVANVQKNTLEVKVAIRNPTPNVRPEMLAQVTFLAPHDPDAAMKVSEQKERLLAPRSLVQSEGESTFAWVAEAGDVARRRSVKLGEGSHGDLVEVVDGLQVTDRLIAGGREGLKDGSKIRVAGEEQTLGIGAMPGQETAGQGRITQKQHKKAS